MNDVKALAAVAALNEMFDKGWLSICTINNVAKMLGIEPEREAYNTLHALHCVHFNKMPKDLRSQVPGLIQRCLAQGEQAFRFELKTEPSNALAVIDASPHTRRPLLQRVLGR